MKKIIRLLGLFAIIAIAFAACDNGTTTGGPDKPTPPTDTYDENGFSNQTGDHKDTGTKYDPAGYDKAGWDKNGWNRGGINKETNKPYDKQGNGRDGEKWYDEVTGLDWKGWTADGKRADGNPYDAQGNDINGNKWYGADGYDYQGYNTAGWNREGTLNNKTNTKYDTEGYDYDGYNAAGWDRQNKNKETKTQYDKNGYDYQGFDNQGLDRDGYDRQGKDAWGLPKTEKPVPVETYYYDYNKMTSQGHANRPVEEAQYFMNKYATETATQFSTYCGNTELKNLVLAECNRAQTSGPVDGDVLLGAGLTSNSKIVAFMITKYGNGVNDFDKAMETFRAREYEKMRSVTRTDHTPNANQSEEELQVLYTQLGMNDAQLDQYIQNTMIPQLSTKLGISPVLVQTLLNNIATNEHIYANIDDVRAMGFDPIMLNAGGYADMDKRTENLVSNYLREELNALGFSFNASNTMGDTVSQR